MIYNHIFNHINLPKLTLIPIMTLKVSQSPQHLDAWEWKVVVCKYIKEQSSSRGLLLCTMQSQICTWTMWPEKSSPSSWWIHFFWVPYVIQYVFVMKSGTKLNIVFCSIRYFMSTWFRRQTQKGINKLRKSINKLSGERASKNGISRQHFKPRWP